MIIEQISRDGCTMDTWQFQWEHQKDEHVWICSDYRRHGRASKRHAWRLKATTNRTDHDGNDFASRAGKVVVMPPIPDDVIAEVRKRAAEAPVRGRNG